jgi:hypothetical protein
MNKSENIANLALALSKAQLELSNPKKTSANPFFKSKYADLSEVINVSKTVLAEHGLSVMQFLSYTDMVHVETMMLHSTGEWISETLSLPIMKHDAQSIGSTCTYARRYSWAAICGLAQEDDDANASVGNGNKPVLATKPTIVPNTKGWQNAKDAFIRDGNLLAVLSKATMSSEHQALLMDECKDVA